MSYLNKNSTPWERHVKLMRDYRKVSQDKRVVTDFEVLRKEYRFIDDGNEKEAKGSQAMRQWGRKLAKAYCHKLFKEYALVNLDRYKEGLLGMRWRVENEVVSGKGQFSCGGLPTCDEQQGLCTLEVPFKYKECGVKREALVKLRLCKNCRYKLEYKRLLKKRKIQEEPEVKQDEKIEPHLHPAKKQCIGVKTEPIEEEINPKTERREDPVIKEEPDENHEESEGEKTSPHNNTNKVWREPVEKERVLDEEFDDFLAEMFP